MAGLLALVAQAAPLAADPEPVFAELANYDNGDSEEIVARIGLDAQMRELFRRPSDETISFVPYYLF